MAMMSDLDSAGPARARRPLRERVRVGMRHVVARTRASVGPALAFGAALALVIPAVVALNLGVRDFGFGDKVLTTLSLFAIGSGAGGIITWWLADLLGHALRRRQRFALMVLVMSIVVTGAIAFSFFLQFRAYFAADHADAFSLLWVLQLLFTGAGSLVVFATVGIRMLLPLGLGVILLSAWVFAVCDR
jgi:membrane protein YqaA with SNARE-associated domain